MVARVTGQGQCQRCFAVVSHRKGLAPTKWCSRSCNMREYNLRRSPQSPEQKSRYKLARIMRDGESK